jgi:ABC-type Fe3+/spermidine/putrescine transport system ATPase subunit
MTDDPAGSSPASDTAFLSLERLDKSFGGQPVLTALTLTVRRGEIFALLGPSGSGKTTALRLLAGFETPDAGEIRVAGERVERVPPAKRRFGMVFQHYALFPHMTVADNVAFGLAGTPKGEIAAKVAAALARVDLADFEARPVTQLSGGQQQRVAVARALAPEPRVLLLDEPLSNLDPELRERTRRELRETIQGIGITTVLVTHEQDEAFDLGDRVGVLHAGRLQQVGTPEELYEQPANPFVAGFVGRASILAGTFRRDETTGSPAGRVALAGSGHPPLVWGGLLTPGCAEPPADGDPVQLILRPESLALAGPKSGVLAGAFAAKVRERRFAGPLTYYRVELPVAAGQPWIEVLGGAHEARVGDAVWVAPRPGGLRPRIFPTGVAAGTTTETAS